MGVQSPLRLITKFSSYTYTYDLGYNRTSLMWIPEFEVGSNLRTLNSELIALPNDSKSNFQT